MTNLMLAPTAVAISIIVYIVASIFITRYIISGGKSESEIIKSNQHRKRKANDFTNKYPEADLKRGRNFILAFGFIFAFTSSIFAFSILGARINFIDLGTLKVEQPHIVDIIPPVRIKNKSTEIKELPPPPPPAPVVNINTNLDEEVLTEETKIIEEVKETLVVFKEEKEVVEYIPTITLVERMPKFKGCENLSEDAAYDCTMNKIREYLAKVTYPDYAFYNRIEGKVDLSFVVGVNGVLEDVKIERGADPSLDRASLKYLEKLPKFATSGMQGGKAVKVRFHVPIDFKLRD